MLFLSMAYLPLHLIARIKTSVCFFRIVLRAFDFPESSGDEQLMQSDLKQEGARGKESLIDWNNEQFSLSAFEPMGQRAMLPQEQTEVVLSAKKSASCGSVACAGFALFEAWRSRRYSMAWLEPNGVEETYEGRCSGCGYRCAMLASRQRSMLER